MVTTSYDVSEHQGRPSSYLKLKLLQYSEVLLWNSESVSAAAAVTPDICRVRPSSQFENAAAVTPTHTLYAFTHYDVRL